MLEKFSLPVLLRITGIQCNSLHTCWQFWSDITEPSYVWPNIKDKVIQVIQDWAHTYSDILYLLPHRNMRWVFFMFEWLAVPSRCSSNMKLLQFTFLLY